MKALILAAGFGSRLAPITNDIPKCLVPVNGKPILFKQIDNLLENGIDDETWGATFQNGLYSYYMGDYLIQFDGENETGLFAYKQDPTLKQNLKGTKPEVESEMIKKLKALIQQYLEYMTTKELVVNQ